MLTLTACNGGDGGPLVSDPASSTTAAAPSPAPSAPTTSAPPQPLAWKSIAPAPAARQEVAAAVLDGKVWVVGGLTGAGASARVESYDPATDRWTAQPDLPVGLHHLAVATFRGELVVIGGFQAAGDLYSRPTDRVLALRGGAWVDLPRLRRARGAAAAAVVGDTLLVVGGRDSGQLIAATEAFDGSAWQDRAPIPAPRDHLAAVADARALYAVGGRFLSPGRTAAAFERYDPGRDSWESLPPLPTARGGLGAALANGRIVTAGGEDAAKVFPQVEAFDLAAGAWSDLPPLPTPRHGLGMAAVGNRLFALVGGDEAGVAPSAVAEALA